LNPSSRFNWIFEQLGVSHAVFVDRTPLTICPSLLFVSSLLQVQTQTVTAAQGVGFSCRTAERRPWRGPLSAQWFSRIKGIEESTEGEAPGEPRLKSWTESRLVDGGPREASGFLETPTRRARRLSSGGVLLEERSKSSVRPIGWKKKKEIKGLELRILRNSNYKS